MGLPTTLSPSKAFRTSAGTQIPWKGKVSYLHQSVMEASKGLSLMILSLGRKTSSPWVLMLGFVLIHVESRKNSWECELQIQS